MRNSLLAVLLPLLLCGTLAPAQSKVAEGEYEMRSVAKAGGSQAKVATRWVLYTKSSGGYRLESEIQNQPARMRVLQIEELDDRLVPTWIGYQLYRNDEKEPGITVKCKFSGGAITCGGEFEKRQVPSSAPYKQDGPFWLWMEGLFALDMPWLLDGAVNMAHLEKGNAQVSTINVLGGTAVLIGDAVSVAKLKAVQTPGQNLIVVAPDKPTQWELYSDEESLLEFVGSETVEIGNTKVTAKHYSFTNGGKPTDLWVANPGLLIKMSDREESDSILTNYKQYKKLIPELPVEPQPKKPEQQETK